MITSARYGAAIAKGLQERLASNAKKRPANPERIAERRQQLEVLGLLSGLEEGKTFLVVIPGDTIGRAIGITDDGFVLVKGWEDFPFNPKAIKLPDRRE